jgi:hypothetical protein
VTPILVRPVREQLEHDRVIRLLQARWRRKYTVGVNVGAEQAASIVSGDATLYPDLVLSGPTSHKPDVVVEVETAESVNNLEALAEWVRFGRLRAAFHLYVPTGSVDAAKRLCAGHHIPVAEICTYHLIGDQMRFTTVFKAPEASRPAQRRQVASAGAATSPRRRAATTSRRATPARQRPAAAGTKKPGGTARAKRKS